MKSIFVINKCGFVSIVTLLYRGSISRGFSCGYARKARATQCEPVFFTVSVHREVCYFE